MKIAELYKMTAGEKRANPGKAYTIQINSIIDGKREHGYRAYVADKKEARTVAATFNAKPWNF